MKRLLVVSLAILVVGCDRLSGTKETDGQKVETHDQNEVAQTPEIAALRERAEQGDAEAQFDLARMYRFGEGVPEDDAEAVKWYRLAAEQGEAEAQYNLGTMYAKGVG